MTSSSSRCPMKSLADFLNNLLQPLYDDHTRSTTLSNGASLIERLVDYNETGLMSRTQFVTIKIDNFYNMIPHDGIFAALGRFLSKVVHGSRYNGLLFETIQELTNLYLNNNIFTYNGNIYRYIKGAPLCYSLTRTLGNIYLYDWQTSLIAQLRYNEELYARYHDMIIMTWNPPIEKLQPLFHELNQKDSNIRIITTIGYSVDFLGIHIENRKGRLYTRVYHDQSLPRFVLPYVINHPRLFYRKWYRWALNRAICYSTSINDFDRERLYIELTLLTHGYSLDFIKLIFTNFLPNIMLLFYKIIWIIMFLKNFVVD